MYTFQRKEIGEDTQFSQFLINNPPKQIYVFTFLDTGAAQYSIQVPPGIIHRIHVWDADAEAEHEDVGWQLWLDNVIICPTLVQGAAGYEIPAPGGLGVMHTVEFDYRVLHESKLTAAINGLANLTSGLTVMVEYIAMPVSRSQKKSIKEKDLEVKKS